MTDSECRCMCGLVHPDERDICEDVAATTRAFLREGDGVHLSTPMCAACAGKLDQLRADFGKERAI